MMDARAATASTMPPTRAPPPLAPHEAFTLAFRPGQCLLHRLALVVAQAHLGESGLCVDLLGDLRGRWGRGDRHRLMLVRIRIVEERSLRRAFFRPELEGGLFLERRQIGTA